LAAGGVAAAGVVPSGGRGAVPSGAEAVRGYEGPRKCGFGECKGAGTLACVVRVGG